MKCYSLDSLEFLRLVGDCHISECLKSHCFLGATNIHIHQVTYTSLDNFVAFLQCRHIFQQALGDCKVLQVI